MVKLGVTKGISLYWVEVTIYQQLNPTGIILEVFTCHLESVPPGAGPSDIIESAGGRVNLEYKVRNGRIVPSYTPVTCNFSRMYTDISGSSSGTKILNSHGNTQPGTTGSKKTCRLMPVTYLPLQLPVFPTS